MTTDAKPKSVQVGDPITVTTTIAGRGNFDRVNAPVLEDERGWHKYPPSSKFKQDDEVGISGTKTFETVLSPNEKKQSLPVARIFLFRSGEGTICDAAQRSDGDHRAGRDGCTQNVATSQPASPTPATATRGRAGGPQLQPSRRIFFINSPNDRAAAESFAATLYASRFSGPRKLLPLFSAAWSSRVWKIRQSEDQTIARHDASLRCNMKQPS